MPAVAAPELFRRLLPCPSPVDSHDMMAMNALPPNRIIDHDQLSTTRAKALFALGIVFTPLTTFFVGVRLYARHIKGNRYGMDDALLVAALIFYYTLTVALYLMVFPSWDGHHTLNVPDPIEALKYSAKAGFYGTLSYALVAACVRCSTCVLFIRIFIQRSYRAAAFANLGFNICWGIYSVIITIFQCTPVSKVFNAATPGHCLDQKNLLLSLTIWGVVCDAITWALPVPMVWKLHAPLSIKIGLTAILALGLVAIAIGAIRIWTVVTISFADPLYDLPLATYWAYTETGIGIICAAAASIAPAFERFLVSPSKRVYSSLRSWISSGSGLDRSGNSGGSSQDSTPFPDTVPQHKSEWSLGSEGSHESYVQAVKHLHNADFHPQDVSMRTEISVIREV